MSHPNYPYQQGFPTYPLHSPQQGSASYSTNSFTYSAQNTSLPPTIGFNIGSPMSQQYSNIGDSAQSYGSPYNHNTSILPQYPSGASHTYWNRDSYPSNQTQYASPSSQYCSQSQLAGTSYPTNTYPSASYPTNTYPSASYTTNTYPSASYPTNTYRSNSQFPQIPYPDTGGHVDHTMAYAPPNLPSHNSGHYIISKKSPTVVPAHPFNPQQDAEVLRKAMKGLGTDEKSIINVLTKRNNAQRLEVALQFKTLYGKDLNKELKSELSGNFEKTIIAMMTPPIQYYVKELHSAISGLGTDENVLIEVMCTLTNVEIYRIKEAYQQAYGRSLERDLKGDTSGHFKRLMVSLCTAARDESMLTNPQAAEADAQALHTAGELRWGTDESVFNMILCQRNHAQLRLIFSEYQRLSGHDIETAIKKEFSGDIKNGLLAVVGSIKNQQAFFAHLLYKSMKGLGTRDGDLIRLVVTRCEIDMGDIKREYALAHKETLADAIKGDCSGDYKKCLLALIGEA